MNFFIYAYLKVQSKIGVPFRFSEKRELIAPLSHAVKSTNIHIVVRYPEGTLMSAEDNVVVHLEPIVFKLMSEEPEVILSKTNFDNPPTKSCSSILIELGNLVIKRINLEREVVMHML
jgi:adenylate kinase